MATHMTPGWLPSATACILAVSLQGCATQQSTEEASGDPVAAGCDTVFHCPADGEDIRICANGDQLQVIWQTDGVDAYRLDGPLGQTFSARYSQTAQVIRNSLTWRHLGNRYVAFHYLDESRPEILEAIGVTVINGDHRRTISCNENATSDMTRLQSARQSDAAVSAPQ